MFTPPDGAMNWLKGFADSEEVWKACVATVVKKKIRHNLTIGKPYLLINVYVF